MFKIGRFVLGSSSYVATIVWVSYLGSIGGGRLRDLEFLEEQDMVKVDRHVVHQMLITYSVSVIP